MSPLGQGRKKQTLRPRRLRDSSRSRPPGRPGMPFFSALARLTFCRPAPHSSMPRRHERLRGAPALIGSRAITPKTRSTMTGVICGLPCPSFRRDRQGSLPDRSRPAFSQHHTSLASCRASPSRSSGVHRTSERPHCGIAPSTLGAASPATPPDHGNPDHFRHEPFCSPFRMSLSNSLGASPDIPARHRGGERSHSPNYSTAYPQNMQGGEYLNHRRENPEMNRPANGKRQTTPWPPAGRRRSPTPLPGQAC